MRNALIGEQVRLNDKWVDALKPEEYLLAKPMGLLCGEGPPEPVVGWCVASNPERIEAAIAGYVVYAKHDQYEIVVPRTLWEVVDRTKPWSRER